ncbi:hypothetical protein EJB05_31169, partial [Eragrostis curvula]
MASSFERHGVAACYNGEDCTHSIFDYSCNGIKEFYAEATRRLPLREVPELLAGIKAGGHCFGLADPVTNIILNAIGLLLSEEGPSRAPPIQHERGCFNFITDNNWEEIATRSQVGLRAFMVAYFRPGTTSASPPTTSRWRSSSSTATASRRPNEALLPDGGKLRAAFQIAAAHARHPAPDALARLMTARYPSRLLAPVLAKLRGTEPLTAHDVWSVRDLLARQWPMNPAPAANIEFWCRPDGDTCINRGDDGAVLIWTSVGEDRVAQIAIRNTPDHLRSQQHYISDLTFDDTSSSMEAAAAAAPVGRPCDHELSLKMHLLDTIHAFYIKALAIMPRGGAPLARRLLRAVLVAGHCYGPMDPVSNIILNSAWYDIAFPLAPGAEAELPDGVLGTELIPVRWTASSPSSAEAAASAGMSEREALRCLNSTDCDLSQLLLSSPHGDDNTGTNGDGSFAAAAKAAKHPQHAAFGSFLASLSGEKLDRMRCLLPGRIISDAQWDLLNTIIREASESLLRSREVSVSAQNKAEGLSPWASELVSSKRSGFQSQLTFVRTELNKALRRYCYQHPWEPSYQLDIICGVAVRSGCYHANFLASADDANTDDVTMLPPERSLFFAEFWGSSLSQWKPPSCCPIVSDYCACTGRCSFCEDEANMIVHPASGAHSRADIDASKDLCCSTVHDTHMDRLKGLLNSDYIYFDPERDVEVAKIINDFRNYRASSSPFY